MDNRIKVIAEHFGLEAQERQLMEESAELIQALNKCWRAYTYDGDCVVAKMNLVEEIADVEIMIEQIKYLCGIELGVIHQKNKKLCRMMEMIQPKMVDMIDGVHSLALNYNPDVYRWRADMMEEGCPKPKPGDVVLVDTRRGKQYALVKRTYQLPESEANKHKPVLDIVKFGDDDERKRKVETREPEESWSWPES